MDIVVLDYKSGCVEIYKKVDDKYIDNEYDGDIEEYLSQERDFNSSDSYWMSADKIEFTVYAGDGDLEGIKI